MLTFKAICLVSPDRKAIETDFKVVKKKVPKSVPDADAPLPFQSFISSCFQTKGEYLLLQTTKQDDHNHKA